MSFDLMFKQATECYLNGAYNQAEQICRSLLSFVPENADILNMLGLIAAAKDEHDAAVLYYDDALKKAANKLPIYFNLAVSLAKLSRFDAAIKAYQSVISLAPDAKEAYNNLGAVYEKVNDIQKAKDCYQKAISIDNNYIDAQVNLAVLNNDKAAVKVLSERFENSPLPFYHLALFSFDDKEYGTALKYALKADTLLEYYDIKYLIARIYKKTNNDETALKYFHQALLLNPKSIEVLISLGTLEQDEDYFKKALDLDQKNGQTHLCYADFLYANGRTIEAVEEYHQALLCGENNAALINNFALVIKDLGDEKRALDLMLDAFIKDPQNINISINIAETLVLLYQKDQNEALKIAKLWQKNAPDNVFANHTLNAFEHQNTDNDKIYAQVLFDEFANLYDERMQNINYGVFDKIKSLNLPLKSRILDLGCGTGLAAAHLKDKNSIWIGVDLSQKMLQKAQEKELYQDLIQSDAVTYLQNNTQKFDFILCLDVIEYLQNFETIFKLSFPSVLILSFEQAPANIKTFQISETGRYQHNPDYIKQLLINALYQKINFHTLVLRQENGQYVKGFVCVAEAK